MAAGASSPELFSSIVALFITHSALGLGTIVGSEIFNQLIITAGAIWASQTGTLTLDPYILTREVGFYTLGIGLLYFALRDVRPDPDDPSGKDHIYISFSEACAVFGAYIVYVLVCANMDAIVAMVKPAASAGEKQALIKRQGSKKNRTSLAVTDKEKLPFLLDINQATGGSGLDIVEYESTVSGEKSKTGEAHLRESVINPKFMDPTPRETRKFAFAKNKPSNLYDVEEMEEDEVCCFVCSIVFCFSHGLVTGGR